MSFKNGTCLPTGGGGKLHSHPHSHQQQQQQHHQPPPPPFQQLLQAAGRAHAAQGGPCLLPVAMPVDMPVPAAAAAAAAVAEEPVVVVGAGPGPGPWPGPVRECHQGAASAQLEESAVIRHVCDMHHRLEKLRTQGLVDCLTIEDAQWRSWNLPVRLLAKLLYLILLHDCKEVGSATYAERLYSLKLIWGDTFGHYYVEVRDRRQSEDLFQMSTSPHKLLERIAKGLDRVHQAFPFLDSILLPPSARPITSTTSAVAAAALVGRRRGEDSETITAAMDLSSGSSPTAPSKSGR